MKTRKGTWGVLHLSASVALMLIVLSFTAIAAESTAPTVATKDNVTTVTLPTAWTIVSLQRHSLPLQLPVGIKRDGYVIAAAIEPISAYADELNRASYRLSMMYTVTFKTPEGYTVWTHALPGSVRFIY